MGIEDLLLNKKIVAVVDTFFGDSGKGKIVDYLASLKNNTKPWFSCVYRANGGPNTGHTVVVSGEKYVFHLIPSAALLEDINCYIGKVVKFEPITFFQELNIARKKNKNTIVYVDSDAQIIMPWHVALDNLTEALSGDKKIGTTGKGVGPSKETHDHRKGYFTVEMLVDKDNLAKHLKNVLEDINPKLYAELNRYNGSIVDKFKDIKLADKSSLDLFFIDNKINFDRLMQVYSEYGNMLKYHVRKNILGKLDEKLEKGNKILVEGTQGFFLDIDHGTYPYVTAGLTTRSGLEHDSGLYFDLVFNVVKAYGTRVGRGPFPTELEEKDNELANMIRNKGNEYGSTTGRPRRIGWLDIVALKYALKRNNRTNEQRILALTKLDVLEGMEPFMVFGYSYCNGLKFINTNYDPTTVFMAKSGHKINEGEIEKIIGLKDYKNFGENARSYINRIEELTNSYVALIGTGPDREDIITK